MVPRLVGKAINPVTDARGQLQMSGTSLARRLGLSKQYLLKAEQGTYTNLNPGLLRWTSGVLKKTPNEVNQLYWNFQAAQRRRTRDEIDPHKLVRVEGNQDPGHTLFKRWRESYWPSSFAFSQAICIHPSTIEDYEEGRRTEMPYPLRQALFEVGFIEADWNDKAELPKRIPGKHLEG